MLSWIKEGKNSSTILHILSITFVSLAFLLALITNFGNEELSRIVDLLKNDGAKAYAIFGLVALIFLGAIIAFIFYGSLLIHFLARMVFRIPLSFKDFYQIMKVFYIFLAFAITWQIFNSKNVLISVIFNPFIIFGVIVMCFLFHILSKTNWHKPILFGLFIYFSYIAITFAVLE
jgi:hypothetical protein